MRRGSRQLDGVGSRQLDGVNGMLKCNGSINSLPNMFGPCLQCKFELGCMKSKILPRQRLEVNMDILFLNITADGANGAQVFGRFQRT